MSMFSEPEPVATVVRVLHWATVVTTLRPVCGGEGSATVLGGLVTCPECRERLAVRAHVARPVISRDGMCLACPVPAVPGGVFCGVHAALVAGAEQVAVDAAAAVASQ